MSAAFEAAISSLEKALCERYRVRELPDHLAVAIAAAYEGDLEPIKGLMEGREMYRLAESAAQALAAAQAEMVTTPSRRRHQPVVVEEESTTTEQEPAAKEPVKEDE